MALIKGVNSYVSISEALAYFMDRIDSDDWLNADLSKQSQALVSATARMEEEPWDGYAVSELQSLAFPRAGTYYDPRLGLEIAYGNETPVRVIKGTLELAFHYLQNEGMMGNSDSVETIKVGNITLQNIRPVSEIPDIVRRYIRPLLKNGGARVWWRNN